MLGDKKPKACNGPVMKRTDSHVLGNSTASVSKSGDAHLRPPLRNFAETTFSDDDPRWGKYPTCEDN